MPCKFCGSTNHEELIEVAGVLPRISAVDRAE